MKKLKDVCSMHRVGVLFALVMVFSVFVTPGWAGEKIEKGYLGVNIEKLTAEDKEEFGAKFGILVTKVKRDGPAEKGGLKKYDVIQYFNDNKIRRPDDLVDEVRESRPGSGAKIKVLRDGKALTLKVAIGKLEKKAFAFVPKKKGDFYLFKGGGGYLGVHLHGLSEDLAPYFGVKSDGGALVLGVEKGSPAEKAGFKEGDVIVALQGKKVASPKEISKAISDNKPGEKVKIKILRHKKKKGIEVELGKREYGFNFKSLPNIGKLEKFITPGEGGLNLYWKQDDRERLKRKMKELSGKLKEKYKVVKKKITTYI